MHDGISSTVRDNAILEPTPGKPPAPVVFLELCAGSAALSAAAQKRGFQVFPSTSTGIDFHPSAESWKWICHIQRVPDF